MNKYTLPTGYLVVKGYSKAQLETLSIGDYGKRHNVKADFLGYTKEIDGVPNTECMPLSEKWVVTLSTQYGCRMKCNFCDVPNVPWKGNVSFDDLQAQLSNALNCFPDVRYTERLNIHFARMGEPIFNDHVFKFAEWLAGLGKQWLQEERNLRCEVIHPVLTTSLPANFAKLPSRLYEWCRIKNAMFNGQAGLQFSINSTNAPQREEMFGGMAISLEEFANIADALPMPLGRKYCLNFAYCTDFEIDPHRLCQLFDADKFMCKITPIHNNNACKKNGIETTGGYDTYLPYKEPEEALKSVGFDVLVFVPSMDEEHGLVTCGNAILGGSKMQCNSDAVKILGTIPHIA